MKIILTGIATIALCAASANAQPHFSNPATDLGQDHIQALVVDLGGNGFQPAGAIRTALVTNGVATVAWPAGDANVGFVVAAGATLQEIGAIPPGFAVSSHLQLLQGFIVPGAAVAPETPTAVPAETGAKVNERASRRRVRRTQRARDVWQVLSGADRNRDGRVDANDPVWPQLRLFVDANGNGVIDEGEVSTFAQAGITAIVLPTEAGGDGRFERGKNPGGKVLAVDLTPQE